MKRRHRAFLFGILVGCTITATAFGVRSVLDNIDTLNQAVYHIEAFLSGSKS